MLRSGAVCAGSKTLSDGLRTTVFDVDIADQLMEPVMIAGPDANDACGFGCISMAFRAFKQMPGQLHLRPIGMFQQPDASQRRAFSVPYQHEEAKPMPLPMANSGEESEPRLLRTHSLVLFFQPWRTRHEACECIQVVFLRAAQCQSFRFQNRRRCQWLRHRELPCSDEWWTYVSGTAFKISLWCQLVASNRKTFGQHPGSAISMIMKRLPKSGFAPVAVFTSD